MEKMLLFRPEQVALWRSQVATALTIEAFEAWLLSHASNAIVGRCGEVDSCPIHNYLQDCLPWLDVWVGKNQIKTQIPEHICRQHGYPDEQAAWSGWMALDYFGGHQPLPPQWVRLFIDKLDRSFTVTAHYCPIWADIETDLPYHSYVRAGEALQVLRSLSSYSQVANAA